MRAARQFVFCAIFAFVPLLWAAPSQAAMTQCPGGVFGAPVLNAKGGTKFLCFPGAKRLPKSQRPTYAEAAKARKAATPVLRLTRCPKGRHHIKYHGQFLCMKNAPKAVATPKPTPMTGLPVLKKGVAHPIRDGGDSSAVAQPHTAPKTVAPPAKHH